MSASSAPGAAGRGPRLSLPLGLGLTAALLFGLAIPASKLLLAGAGPVALAALFYLGAGLFLTPSRLRRRRRSGPVLSRLPVADRWRLVAAVLFGGVAGPILLLAGLRLATASTGALLLNLETAATALLAGIWFRENVGRRAWAGVAGIVLAGALLTAVAPEGGVIGGLLIALACLCWGLDNNVTARIENLDPAGITWVKGVAAGTVNAALALLVGDAWPTPTLAVAALVVGGLAYGVSIALYIESARWLGATRSQLVFAAAPFFGFAAVLLLARGGVLAESIGVTQALALALFALSLWLVLAERHGHHHLHRPMAHAHRHGHPDDHHRHDHSPAQAAALGTGGYHSHPHPHSTRAHTHPHWPDLHHAHEH